MTTTELQDFFEKEDFQVHLFEQDNEQCAEVEKWTDGGVDMIFELMPFVEKEFIKRVENFDVDEEIDFYRECQDYKKDFTVSESLKDFTNFHKDLKKTAKKLEKLMNKTPRNEKKI
jgi:2-succinyl-5-enolpyruvyl-6-hydroxy-3-cyclohexene-1-carboxylate synthase